MYIMNLCNEYIKKEINQIVKNKYKYNIYECILRIIDNEICLLNFKDINIKSNILKKKLANDLVLNNLHKKFDYDLKKQKDIIYNFLISSNINLPITNNIIKYISIYLNVNILIIYNNLYRFVNIYNENIKTIILVEKEKDVKYYPYIYEKNNVTKEIFNNDDIIDIIKLYSINNEIIIDDNVSFNTQFNKLKKYDLNKIIEICKFYKMNIYLDDKNTKIKPKKKIFEELYDILYNK